MYCRSSKLDNDLMSHLIKLSSPVAMVNVFCDTLMVLTNDKRVYLYAMDRQETPQGKRIYCMSSLKHSYLFDK